MAADDALLLTRAEATERLHVFRRLAKSGHLAEVQVAAAPAKAAASAIKVICQPAVPPTVTIRSVPGTGAMPVVPYDPPGGGITLAKAAGMVAATLPQAAAGLHQHPRRRLCLRLSVEWRYGWGRMVHAARRLTPRRGQGGDQLIQLCSAERAISACPAGPPTGSVHRSVSQSARPAVASS